MNTVGISAAAKLFKKRRYAEVINILEPQLFPFRDNFLYHKLLGMSYLYTGDTGSAYTFLSRASHLTDFDPYVNQALGAIHFKEQENNRALELWLENIEHNPKDRLAQKSLQLIRKVKDEMSFYKFIESDKFASILPPEPFSFSPAHALLIITSLLVVCLGAFTVFNLMTPKAYNRDVLQNLAFNPTNAAYKSLNSDTRFIFSEDEIKNRLDNIFMLFEDYKDHLAIKEINELLLSNASDEIKNRCSLLLKEVNAPDFTNIGPTYSYEEILQDPQLHNGVYVHWKGRAVNVVEGEKQITFNFLVGYDNKQTLEGEIPVILQFGYIIETDFPYEIIGQVKSTDQGAYIIANSIHKINSF